MSDKITFLFSKPVDSETFFSLYYHLLHNQGHCGTVTTPGNVDWIPDLHQ